jgi:hypothetical protein
LRREREQTFRENRGDKDDFYITHQIVRDKFEELMKISETTA